VVTIVRFKRIHVTVARSSDPFGLFVGRETPRLDVQSLVRAFRRTGRPTSRPNLADDYLHFARREIQSLVSRRFVLVDSTRVGRRKPGSVHRELEVHRR